MTTSPKAFEILFQGRSVLVLPQLRDPEREQIIAWMAAAEPAD